MTTKKQCPICLSVKNKVFLKGHKFELYKCKKCLLISTKVREGADKVYPSNNLYQDKEEALNQFTNKGSQYRSYAKDILSFTSLKDGNFLDIGCGIGWTVREAENIGFKSLGIDPSNSYVAIGKKYLNVKLHATSLEKYKTNRKFDLITSNHVLEHIESPNVFLSKARKILREGGKVIISVPNIDSVMFKIFRGRWYGLVPTQHLWQFSPKTLSQILKRNGFKVVKVKTNNLDYDVKGIKGLFFKFITFAAPLINQGDQIFLLAQKA